MRDSSIKTSIEKAIGEEAWLTEDVVRNMAGEQRPNKKNWQQLVIPTMAILSIVIGSLFLFLTQPNTQEWVGANPDWRQIELAIEDENMEAAFKSYLKASVDQDYAAFEEVSTTTIVASPKEVFERYEQIDWSTFRIVAIAASRGEPVTSVQAAFQYKESDVEVVQTYSIDAHDGENITISEPIYEDLPEYTPFVFPERLELTYVEIPEARIVEREFTDEELLHVIDIHEPGSAILVHKVQDGEYEFYARTGEGTFYLTTIYGKAALNNSSASILNQETGEAGYYLQFEDLGTIGLVFFGDKVHFLETPLDYQLERRILPGDDMESILVNDEYGLQILRYNEETFEGASVRFPSHNENFPGAHVTYQLGERANHFQVISGFLEGEKKAIYEFEDQETIVKRN